MSNRLETILPANNILPGQNKFPILRAKQGHSPPTRWPGWKLLGTQMPDSLGCNTATNRRRIKLVTNRHPISSSLDVG